MLVLCACSEPPAALNNPPVVAVYDRALGAFAMPVWQVAFAPDGRTLAAAAADGSTDAAAEGGAADGAVLLLPVLLPQAAMTRASTARITMERQRIDTTRPPLTRDQTLGFDVAR